MTTIVFDKKSNTICYDSRVSCMTDIVTDNYEKKHVGPEGTLFFSAGSVADTEAFVQVYEDSSLRADLDMQAIVIENGTAYLASPDGEGGLNVCPLEYNFAIGSGYQWALAALDYGATPREAIKYATTKDSATGGKIRTYKVG